MPRADAHTHRRAVEHGARRVGVRSRHLPSRHRTARRRAAACAHRIVRPLARSITKLKHNGIHSIQSLQMQSHRMLVQIKGLSDAKVDKMMDGALKLCEPVHRFQTAKDVQAQRDDFCVKITTGCSDFDNMLAGGVECAPTRSARPDGAPRSQRPQS